MKIIKKRYSYSYTPIRGINTYGTNAYSIFRDPVLVDAPLDYLRFIIENGLNWMYKKDSIKYNQYL